MSATVHSLHTFPAAQEGALLIARLEAEIATLTEELAQTRADLALLREGNGHLLDQYAAAMKQLTVALEWKGNAALMGFAGGFAFLFMLWAAS
jgi:hypothetical protein